MQEARALINSTVAEQARNIAGIARLLGMNPNTLKSMLNGNRRLTPDVAQRVSDLLGIPRSVITRLIESDAAASVPSEVA